MLGSWYPECVHIHVFMGIHVNINNQKVQNSKFLSKFILLITKTYYAKAFNLRLVQENIEAG